jgi:hypothetical protein
MMLKLPSQCRLPGRVEEIEVIGHMKVAPLFITSFDAEYVLMLKLMLSRLPP